MDSQIGNAGGYTNYTSQLFYQPDPRLGTTYVAYAAPFRSFVWDSGVAGANILQSVSGSFGHLTHGQSGMIIDYQNGRVLLPASFGTTLTMSGSYAFKEFNVYFSNQTAEKLVFGNKYYLNSRFNGSPTGVPPIEWNQKLGAYNMVTPCVFVTSANATNEGWAFGGVYNSKQTISLNILAESPGQLENILSMFVDQKSSWVQMLPLSAWPLNNLGDTKSGYNYQTVASQYNDPKNQLFVSSVKASKVSDYAKIDESVFLGVVDMACELAGRTLF